MKKQEIMIDVANFNKCTEIIRTAYEAAEKFVNKVDAWKAKSVETYIELKALMQMIEDTNAIENRFNISIFDDKENTVDIDVDGDFWRIMMSVAKNLEILKRVIRTACEKVDTPYEEAIAMMIDVMKWPIKWNLVE